MIQVCGVTYWCTWTDNDTRRKCPMTIWCPRTGGTSSCVESIRGRHCTKSCRVQWWLHNYTGWRCTIIRRQWFISQIIKRRTRRWGCYCRRLSGSLWIGLRRWRCAILWWFPLLRFCFVWIFWARKLLMLNGLADDHFQNDTVAIWRVFSIKMTYNPLSETFHLGKLLSGRCKRHKISIIWYALDVVDLWAPLFLSANNSNFKVKRSRHLSCCGEYADPILMRL